MDDDVWRACREVSAGADRLVANHPQGLRRFPWRPDIALVARHSMWLGALGRLRGGGLLRGLGRQVRNSKEPALAATVTDANVIFSTHASAAPSRSTLSST
jgi:hypothetical protein